jgi:hypothetical protein
LRGVALVLPGAECDANALPWNIFAPGLALAGAGGAVWRERVGMERVGATAAARPALQLSVDKVETHGFRHS